MVKVEQPQFHSYRTHLSQWLKGTLDPNPGAYPWLLRWQVWGRLSIVTSLGVITLSTLLLLRQPTTTGNCQFVVWPFASAAFRLYCAQEAADRQTLEDLILAIKLVDDLPADHPLAPEINRWIEAWSDQVLELANAAFHQGHLDRAITFARRIPNHVSAYAKVEESIERWQTVWKEGEIIYREAELALKNLQWREAFQISLDLMYVNCRYWSRDQFEALNRRIIQAQKEDRELDQARALISQGGAKNLAAAMKLVREIDPSSDVYPGAVRLLNEISDRLLEEAKAALVALDIDTAEVTAQLIPRDMRPWQAGQDILRLVAAERLARRGMGQELSTAIAQTRRILPQRPMYSQAQDFIRRWQRDTQLLQTLAQAQQTARSGTVENLWAAVYHLQTIPQGGSPYRQEQVQRQLNQWQRQAKTLEDQPLLDRADQLASLGGDQALEEARQLLRQIRSGRPLYDEAQARLDRLEPVTSTLVTADPRDDPMFHLPGVEIADGPPQDQARLSQAYRRARGGTPEALSQAILIANDVPMMSPLRFQANELIDQWGELILTQARFYGERDSSQAIATAQLIPPHHRLYPEAQNLIQGWQARETVPDFGF
ncbi:hypothetical protein L3556_03055 [Candidatus Synechococcus calcipolaris G9]|uniref:Chromosome segregation ATPase n=1 Tax=Candidatus Synechococcus calcipolaris G9 TaxID=1497997 RepID=A0ABT6EXF0_9SYNE|nr:hypothetical protein [Candidatus Synechococcus calcipolaris]MDG2989916.1 hypothetical protein [Candidatus Synechococcus calcipolaris G9]